MVFAYRAGGMTFGWFAGWMMVLAYLGVAVWEGIALAMALDYLLPILEKIYLWDVAGSPVYLSWSLIGMLGALVVLLLNLFGVRQAVIFQVLATIAIFAVGIMMLLGGISFGNPEYIGRRFTGSSGFFYVLMMIPSMMVGFDVIPQSVEEMNIAQRDIGKMMIVCIVMSSVWYLMMILGIGFGAPQEVRSSGSLPAVNVIIYIFGNKGFGALLAGIGLLGILTSWNGFFMGATRLLFSMGRARMIPKAFGAIGKRFHTPWVATLVVGLLCIIAPLFGRTILNLMISISSICTLCSYCCVTICTLILRYREPHLARPFRAGQSNVGVWIIVLLTMAYTVIYVACAMSNRDYLVTAIVVILWFTVGGVLYVIAMMEGTGISREQREILIFGDRFARMPRHKQSGK